MITELKSNQVIVFGSNIQGLHNGGAARQALEFGAIYGKGVGIQGQSYAIPTMEGLEIMKLYIDDFIDYAINHQEKEFLLTKIGQGIAGYTAEQVEPLLKNLPKNVIMV